VIVLREIEGLEYQEIADRVGISIGTVMSRLFYARKKLQIMLRDVYETL
jgi:RNA polymerase sigma-70 factor (ECF subfamily)